MLKMKQSLNEELYYIMNITRHDTTTNTMVKFDKVCKVNICALSDCVASTSDKI